MRGRVYEVAPGDQRCRKADGGTVQGGDQDLGEGVEDAGYVQVVGDEGFQPVSSDVFVRGRLTREGYICAAAGEEGGMSMSKRFTVVCVIYTYAEKKRPLPVRTAMYISSIEAMSLSTVAKR